MSGWQYVDGFEGRYIVNRAGEVHSFGWTDDRGVFNKPRRMRPHVMKNGYWGVFLGGKKRKKGLYIHRLVALAFIPNPDGKPHVNHKDGDKQNNALSNLEWCTHRENMRHAYRTGLLPAPPLTQPGEGCRLAKLTEEKVREIRRRVAAGETQTAVARDYAVTKGAVGHIVRRDTWTHI